MTVEQLLKLSNQARRLHFFLERDRNGWAPYGTDMGKLGRIVEKAWRRCEHRQQMLEARLRQVQEARG